MGVVYKVRHRGWDMELAVKSPLQSALDRVGGEGAFIAEAEAWIDLGLHPNIATCYYVRKLGPVPRLFAEYVQGGSLQNWIEKGLLRDPENILDVAIQFAWGLDYAHERAWHDGNGHSHVQAALLGPSLSVPVRKGRLMLGTWQQVVVLNHDNKSRRRHVEVTLIGTKGRS